MVKKLTLMALSVAALAAFAVPAAAQAEGPLITNAFGEAASTIEATSENTVSTTTAGTLECTTVTLHVELSANENTTAAGSGTGTAVGNPKIPSHTGRCASSSGLGVEITSITVSSLHLEGNSGTAAFSYTYDLYSGTTKVAHCTFNGTANVTVTGTSSISISGKLTKGEPSSAACPGEGTIKGDFELDDEFGLPAHID